MSKETYYYSEVFDTFKEASVAQQLKLLEYITEGKAIRGCSLDYELDYDTKKERYIVFVRPFPNG